MYGDISNESLFRPTLIIPPPFMTSIIDESIRANLRTLNAMFTNLRAAKASAGCLRWAGSPPQITRPGGRFYTPEEAESVHLFVPSLPSFVSDVAHLGSFLFLIE